MIKSNHKNKLILKLSMALIMTFYLTMLSSPTPANAGMMQWTIVDTPSSSFNVIVNPSEVNAIAIGPDGITVYALDIPHSKVYKSIDGGMRWDDITSYLTGAGATMPAWDIAVAPDNPNFVALVTTSAGLPRNVFISVDGGSIWQNTNCPVTSNIGAIDISPNYGSYDIVIGTRTGTGGGTVHIFKTPGYGGWVDQGFTGDVLAARFPTTYTSDSSLVVASADGTGSYVNIGVRDIIANTTHWGTWEPVEITTAGPGTSPKVNQIITADLELPFDFSGQVASLRRIYISTNDAGASGNAGVYRADDTIVHKLMPPPSVQAVSSIAYYGDYNAGKLMVAEVKADASSAAVDVWYCSNPGATCPQSTCLIWQKSIKPPTGGGNSGYANAQVAWSPDGSRSYCGTSSANLDITGWPNGYLTSGTLDESAFSVTLDNGRSWNQLSLIDTEVSFLSDVTASTNSDTVYLASINTNGGFTGFDSLWRSTGYPSGRVWERVLCVLATSDDTILRMSPAQAEQSIFIAVRSTSDLFQSKDFGQTWDRILPGVNITDFTVTTIDGVPHMFVLENYFVRKGSYSNQVWKWGIKSNTSLDSGHTVTATTTGIVLVGDATQGIIAYSEDGGIQFTRLSPIPVAGKVHAVIDNRIRNYIVIYAASDAPEGKVYSWVVGPSSRWIPMASLGQSYYGLAQIGTLYCSWSSGGNTAVDRTLTPEALGPPDVEWDSMTSGLDAGVIFTREPTSLKVSNGVDLWAIDNRAYTATTGHLWSYHDGLTPVPLPISARPSHEFLYQAPTLVTPAMDAVISLDPNTEELVDIEFKWEHPTEAVGYDLWIAKDKEFNNPVIQESITPDIPAAPKWSLSTNKSPLEAGKTYYWKVRVRRDATFERGTGQWSKVMSFSTEAKTTPESVHTGPGLIFPENNAINADRSPTFNWTPVPKATEYEFTLARDKSLGQIVTSLNVTATTYTYSAELEQGITYFWRVTVTRPFHSQPSPVFSFTVATDKKTEPPLGLPYLSVWLLIVIAVLVAALIIALIVIIKGKKVSKA